MKRKPIRWASALKKLFSPVRRKPVSTRLAVETLDDRIVPATYNPNALAVDGAVGSLRADLTLANNDTTTNATETFDLTAGATYTLTIPNPLSGHEQKNLSGDLNIENFHGAGTKTYTFVGLGSGATIQQTVADRVFEIIGKNANVVFRNVTIIGGDAQDNGGVGAPQAQTPAWGGGILNEGANVTLQNVSITENIAQGGFGVSGFNGSNATKAGQFPGFGGDAASGGSAFGGGLYSTAGTITIVSSTISNNSARGGPGGQGGAGGNVSKAATGSAGSGGFGGDGGNATGGGIYIASGNLIINTESKVDENTAIAGVGGAGGAGGKDGVKSEPFFAGAGGLGGTGGNAEGGGIYSAVGAITLAGADDVVDNEALGGLGGAGGAGGNGTQAYNNGGFGGIGGAGGSASGGGLFAQLGNVTLNTKATVNGNFAVGANGAVGGAGGSGQAAKSISLSYEGAHGGTGGVGGSAFGGGLYAVNGVILIEGSSHVTTNEATAGAGAGGGAGGSGKRHFGGTGGAGGAGGSVAGGGLYSGLGAITIEEDSSVNSNAAKANGGGSGGAGGAVNIVSARAGSGGAGGAGGNASGGGIYATSGNVMVLSDSTVNSNELFGVAGGGNGGVGGNDSAKTGSAGAGGVGGAGDSVFGGGIYIANGNVNVATSFVSGNKILGNTGGNGANGGTAPAAGAFGGVGGAGGDGGSAFGGGIYAINGIMTINDGGIGSNEIEAGAGGNGGNGGADKSQTAGFGGAGGAGGDAGGGGLYVETGKVVVEATGVVNDNAVEGAKGGDGGTAGHTAFRYFFLGGAAGSGGAAAGGGIWASAAAVSISGNVVSNGVLGGNGGIGGQAGTIIEGGGTGGAGGAAGNAQGGGIYSVSGTITILTHAKIEFNAVSGGMGGSGGNGHNDGGAGGVAGNGQGGGIYSGAGNVSITSSLIASNSAAGNIGGVGGIGGFAEITTPTVGTTPVSSGSGEGGPGGNGGAAQGGGIYIASGNLTLEHASIKQNKAGGDLAGGAGGGSYDTAGGAGGIGGNGGEASGGGIYVSSGAVSLTMQDSSVTSNSAGPGGAPGTGGATSGNDGNGGKVMGGGIYTAANSLILDSTIAFNNAEVAGGAALSEGGGVYVSALPVGNDGGTTINNSTIAFNTANDEGGGIQNQGNLSLTSTMVVENTCVTTGDSDFSDAGTTIATDSLIQTATGNSVTNGANGDIVGVTDSAINLNTALQLASNGTQYLNFTGPSVAFQAGSNPNGLITDQIGQPRSIKGLTDIGSIETGSATSGVPLMVAAGKNGFVVVSNASTHAVIQDFQPFAGYTGVVSVALGDVNGDGIPDIIVAAKGLVKVYDGASALVTGVNFNVPTTWTRYLPSANGRTTPVLYQLTPFAGYIGALNVASGDVNGDGLADIVVGTVAGTQGRVTVFSGATGTRLGSVFYPFGSSFTGGISVTAGDVTGDGPAEVIVGTQTKGDQVKIYMLSGTNYDQLGLTISAFGTIPSTAQLQVAAINANGTGVDDIAIGLLSGGIGKVYIVDESGDFISSVNVGGGLTAMAISAYNSANTGADSLLIGTIPSGPVQFHVVDPLTGALTSSFSELPALTGGISLAGI